MTTSSVLTGYSIPTVSTACAVLGYLALFGWVHLPNDLEGPIVVTLWIIGFALPSLGIFLGIGSVWINRVTLLPNLLGLLWIAFIFLSLELGGALTIF